MAIAPTTPNDMKERIRRAFTEITPQMLAEVRRYFISQLTSAKKSITVVRVTQKTLSSYFLLQYIVYYNDTW